MRALLLSSTLAGLCLSTTASALPIDAAGRMIARLMPEQRSENASPPAYLDEAAVAAFDLEAGHVRRVIWNDADVSPRLRAAALLRLGNHEAAVDLMADAGTVDELVLLGEVEADRGRYADAIDALLRAVDFDSTSFVARAALGQTYEAAGDIEAAIETYRWFDDARILPRFYQNRDAFTDADELVAAATSIDRLATLSLEYATNPDLQDDVLTMLIYAYDVADRGHVKARVAAASFAYDRSDAKAAFEDVAAALTRRPNDADALALLGQMHLDRFGFAEAAAVSAALRKVDPASREADLLDGRSLMLQRQPDRAEAPIVRQLRRDPNDVRALGLLAASRAMRLDQAGADALLARVDELRPDDAVARYQIGEQLAITRQYDRAADLLADVVERAPWWTAARNKLANVYVQAGEERQAIVELRRARDLDPFNAETANYLQLLEEMAGYGAQETMHFIVRHDPDVDPGDALVADLMAAWLDEMHDDVASGFDWEPDRPTEIQVFPTHDRFSVRVAGDPYIGTVGACTGPVIALVAPRDNGETLGSFDWARVMRHEYIHTVTLGATDNRIWHWYTEGLAVRGEDAPISQSQLNLLAGATLNGGLFGIEDLTWGFVRPRKPTDRSQAYAQSWMVCEYLVELHGEEVLADLIDACRRGLTERQALADLFDLSPSEFDEAFAVWMQERVASWGHDAETSRAYAEQMRAGEQAVRQRDWPTAAAAFELAAELRPFDEGPSRRLAGIYLVQERLADAADRLSWLAVRTTTDSRFATRAAGLWLRVDEPERAVEMAQLAVFGNSYDLANHELLLAAHEAAGNTEAADAQRAIVERVRAFED
ncbi:MAG: hypothetical protein AAGI46_14160 [Planctomycetota bacterium]